VLFRSLFAGLAALTPAEDFAPACEKGCVEQGAEIAYCRAVCLCTEREAETGGALAGATDAAARGARLREIAARCAAKQKE
jgi:hypothetical protein